MAWKALLNEAGDPENAPAREEEMFIEHNGARAFAWRFPNMGGTWVRAFAQRKWMRGPEMGMRRCRTAEAAAEHAAKILGLKKVVALPEYGAALARDRAEHARATEQADQARRDKAAGRSAALAAAVEGE